MIKVNGCWVNAASAKNVALVAVLLTLAVFGATLTFGFVWDDFPTLVHNASLHQNSTLWKAFTHDYWGLHEVSQKSGYWRPIPTLLYFFVAQILGVHAWGFHLLNLLFHVGVVLCVTKFFSRVGLTGHVLILASTLFAVHPLHAETVSFVSALPDLSSALFGFLFLNSWIHSEITLRRRLAGLLFLWLSLLSKESAVAFPLIYALIAPKSTSKTFQFSTVLLVGSVFFYLLLHQLVVGTMGSRPPWGGGWLAHLATVTRLWVHAVGLAVVPRGFSPTRAFELSTGWSEPWVWGALLVVAALIWSVFRLRTKEPEIARGMALFGLFWLPVSNLIPAEGLIADRYFYLPLVGMTMVAGSIGSRWGKVIPLALVLTSAGVAGWTTRIWRSEETLWKHAALESARPTCLAWNQWGALLMGKGEWVGAIQAFESALLIDSQYSEALLNLSRTYLKQGKPKEAQDVLNRMSPRMRTSADFFDLSSAIHEASGDLPGAILFSKKAVEISPGQWQYLFNLATALIQAREMKEAISLLERARELAPERSEVWLNLASARYYSGEKEEAIQILMQMIRKWPDHAKAKENLAVIEGAP